MTGLECSEPTIEIQKRIISSTMEQSQPRSIHSNFLITETFYIKGCRTAAVASSSQAECLVFESQPRQT